MASPRLASPRVLSSKRWLYVTMCGLALAGSATGCRDEPHGSDIPERPAASRTDPFSSAGTERVIPLSIFQMYDVSAAQDAQVFRWIQDNVQVANETFRPAGVQFVIREYRKCNGDGTFAENDNSRIPYADARDELDCVFGAGTVPDPAFPQKPVKHAWLEWAQLYYGRKSDVYVWLHQTFPGYSGNGVLPWAGPPTVHLRATGYDPWPRNLLAHELGHTLGGFGHADQLLVAVNPRTNANYTAADFWDLVHHAPTDRFFTSRDDLVSHQSQHGYPDSELSFIVPTYHPSADACGRARVTIGGQQHVVPDARLKGLGRPLSTPCVPGVSWSYATNIMAVAIEPTPNFYGHLADSQIERLRNYLRYEAPIRDDHWVPQAQGRAHGRTKLGNFVHRQPAASLDFNQDGRRDIGWWIPPQTSGVNGEFHVLLSGGAAPFTDERVVPMGRLGDIPVPADYNADGITDLAVFSPGGGLNYDNPFDNQGYWRMCITPSNLSGWSCNAPVSYRAGRRGDVPLPGLDFDGNPATAHLSVYRPATGAWYWGPVADWTFVSFRTIGNTVSIPLPDLYDSDDKTDLAVYDPSTAQVKLRLSSSNWNTLVTRQFYPVTSLVASVGASAEERSGAIAVRGMYRRAYVGTVSGVPIWKPRAAVSVWSPWNGLWYTMWDPASSGTQQACMHGQSGDVPIGGVGTDWRTTNSDTQDHSKLTLYRSDVYGGTSYFKFLSPLPNVDCRYSTAHDVYFVWAPSKSLVFAVRDMTGDGLPEIVLLNPNSGRLHYFTSPDFTIAYFVELGSHFAVVL